MIGFNGATLFRAAVPTPFFSFQAGAASYRSGVLVKSSPVNGGDPGFVERVFLIAERPDRRVYYFSLLKSDLHP